MSIGISLTGAIVDDDEQTPCLLNDGFRAFAHAVC